MYRLSIDPNIVSLLQGLKPFLSQRSQVVTDGVLSVIQLLTSQYGQEAIHTVSKLFTPPAGKDNVSAAQETGTVPVIFPSNLAFTLFLILILLILSGNVLAINSHLKKAVGDDFKQSVPENSTAV